MKASAIDGPGMHTTAFSINFQICVHTDGLNTVLYECGKQKACCVNRAQSVVIICKKRHIENQTLDLLKNGFLCALSNCLQLTHYLAD